MPLNLKLMKSLHTYYHQQKINSLRSIAKIFEDCHGRITHFALQKAQNNLLSVATLDKEQRCNGFHKKRTAIPCKHQLTELIELGQNVEPEKFHPQWHIKVWSFLFFFPFFPFFPLFLLFLGGSSWELMANLPIFSVFLGGGIVWKGWQKIQFWESLGVCV